MTLRLHPLWSSLKILKGNRPSLRQANPCFTFSTPGFWSTFPRHRWAGAEIRKFGWFVPPIFGSLIADQSLTKSITGWWFGIFFIFPYIGNNNPNWLSYFSEGLKPPTSHISPYLHITDMWPVHRERSRLGAAAGAVREGENTLHLHRGAVRKTLSCGPIGYMEVSWTMATPSHMFSHWLWTNLDLVVPPF